MQTEATVARNLYREVTDKILAELRKGAAPWIKPWSGYAGPANPRNLVTGRPYSGANVVLLWITQQERGYERPVYLTYKQAEEIGANVRKGETGTTVCFVNSFAKKEEGADEERRIPFLKAYTVFNVAQCENVPEKFTGTPKVRNADERIADVEAFIQSTGAIIGHGEGQAYYRPTTDTIMMPHFEAFRSAHHYYSTHLHELGHWTGAEKRLNRQLKNRFGDQAYAAEELIAELTSAFLCAEFGFDSELRHAGYIESWIKVLQKDERAFFTAASQASKAAEFMRSLALAEPERMAA